MNPITKLTFNKNRMKLHKQYMLYQNTPPQMLGHLYSRHSRPLPILPIHGITDLKISVADGHAHCQLAILLGRYRRTNCLQVKPISLLGKLKGLIKNVRCFKVYSINVLLDLNIITPNKPKIKSQNVFGPVCARLIYCISCS